LRFDSERSWGRKESVNLAKMEMKERRQKRTITNENGDGKENGECGRVERREGNSEWLTG
jgi:hypothetical protein